jgi:CRISPR-associated protein Cas2
VKRNGWRVMWIVAVYDCPTTSEEAKQSYTAFRKSLLRENFIQLQKSVYVRNYPTIAKAEAVIARLGRGIPTDAEVAFFLVTDKQYGLTREFFGPRSAEKRPDLPEQIGLFS